MLDIKDHGKHIASLLISNFQAIAPELVASGFFKIVAPPYYAVYPKNGKGDKCTYVRDKDDLPQWCAEVIFYPRFRLDAVYHSALNIPSKTLNEEEFKIITGIAYQYGLAMDNLSEELSINPLLLEAFLSCTHYLTPETMNEEIIRESLGADRVTYDRPNNTLIVTMAAEDTVIPLLNFNSRIYNEGLLQMMARLNWSTWQLYITTLKTSTLKESPITLYQLYYMFRECEKREIRVKTLKGLGSMLPQDSARTCMDPRNRRVINITSSGDVASIFRLLGDESAPRKLLTAATDLPDDIFGSL